MKNMKRDTPKICSTCEHCVYIGEGDFICDIDEQVIVMEDFMPNENYNCCNECDWEKADDDDE